MTYDTTCHVVTWNHLLMEPYKKNWLRKQCSLVIILHRWAMTFLRLWMAMLMILPLKLALMRLYRYCLFKLLLVRISFITWHLAFSYILGLCLLYPSGSSSSDPRHSSSQRSCHAHWKMTSSVGSRFCVSDSVYYCAFVDTPLTSACFSRAYLR